MENKIKNILDEKGISILAFSEMINMTYAGAHRLVNRPDIGTTTIEVLETVAAALEVEISDLYGGE